MLRLQSYLAPSLPYGFFRAIADDLAETLGIAVELTFETRTSGPVEGEADPLSAGVVDVAFLCAPTYQWLARTGAARLLAAPVSSDPRAEGRPVYFSDVVVRAGAEVPQLSAARWALNDPASLSGFRCVVDAIGEPADVIVSGSHLASLELVRRGEADAAAIDSNVLRLHPLGDALKVAGTFGPHPIQPIVARTTLDPVLSDRVRDALLTSASRAPGRFSVFGFVGFAAVEHSMYAPTARSGRVRHRMIDEPTHPGLRAASG